MLGHGVLNDSHYEVIGSYLLVPLGDGLLRHRRSLQTRPCGVVLVKAVAVGGIELDAKRLDEVVDRVLHGLFGSDLLGDWDPPSLKGKGLHRALRSC